ncbi:hypothetical protein yc1106_07604 [Curvularia clavata]|uniref:Heterokaryon incompatibility domain-containing protein n=1 Tax=Curvularia clavata TaxID=95742 RepID=A0A9Q8ZEN4_CURCL|nr:hypothetical protein yc1106_07604 [Curvularia clavata]
MASTSIFPLKSNQTSYASRIREWIDACDTTHGDTCVPKPLSQQPQEDVPVWLIDTQEQCLVPGSSADRYLALSYTWPETRDSSTPSPRSLLLDAESVAGLQTPGCFSSAAIAELLPGVIKHAMRVTVALNERFLWVDRLCILQNDAGTLDQVTRMDRIYAGAYLTIVAAAPDSMYQSDRTSEWPNFNTMYNYLGSSQLTQDNIVRVMDGRYEVLRASRWATRGWTYQEQILCKRAVMFTDKGIFWDCQRCLWDGADLKPGQYYKTTSVYTDMGQRFSTRWWPDFGFYIDLICPYNGRDFSYPQDALLGISGVLSALSGSFPGPFVSGIPAMFLDHVLLWQPFETAERRVDRDQPSSTSGAVSSLPSWAWCGWQCYVDPESLRPGLAYIDDPKINNRSRSWRTRNLVEWHLSNEEGQVELIPEPKMFDEHVSLSSSPDTLLPEDWHVHTALGKDSLRFSHAKDHEVLFKHPIPLSLATSPHPNLTTAPHLVFQTTTAKFHIASVMRPQKPQSLISWGASKVSVWQDRMFALGPREGKIPPVLVLQQPNGLFAGLFRLMNNDKLNPHEPVELIALSTGSATIADLEYTIEWDVFTHRQIFYTYGNEGKLIPFGTPPLSRHQRRALLCDITLVFDPDAGKETDSRAVSDVDALEAAVEKSVQEDMEANKDTLSAYGEEYRMRFELKLWHQARKKVLDTLAEERKKEEPANAEAKCEFYNVLWVQRREGVAYRVACGWVPKVVWEAHASEPVEAYYHPSHLSPSRPRTSTHHTPPARTIDVCFEMGETFDWDYPGLNWSHFHSLANLLALRNGGQAEASSLSNAVLDEDYSSDNNDNAGAPSVDTGCADLITDSGHGRLKQKFLDCLAEFAANKKGGTRVACSAMRESKDSVYIWIARNEGFSEAEKPIFTALERLLESYSRGEDLRLWEVLVSFHQSRIQSSYIPDLRASFKAFEVGSRETYVDTTGESPDPASKLSILRGLLFDTNINGGSTFDRHSELVIAAYDLRRSKTIEKMLNSSPQASSTSKRLWVNICLTARLRVACEKFKETALTFPSFMHITIALVARPPAPTRPPYRLMKLRETFDILGLDTKKGTIQAVMGPKWTLSQLEHEFMERQRQKLKIHAEVQLLMHLNTSNSSGPETLPYIGCSKLCCFMCHAFIQSYGHFNTRGCHGRLFKPWTIPNVELPLPKQVKRISEAVISLQNEIVKKLVTPVAGKVRHERTSVLGGSSLIGTQHDEISARRVQIDHLAMKAEQDRVAEMFRRRSERSETLVNRYHSTSNDEAYKTECDLTSADYLWKSLGEDIIPVDEDVLQDFGFNAIDARDRSNLFGLYQGVRLFGDITSSDLHEWRVKGIMVEKIKEIFYRIPESHRGQYFPWWLKNLHRLQKPTTKEEAEGSLAETFFDKAKLYLDPRDRNMHPSELKPEAKRDSFFLLSHILHRHTPNPSTMLYHTFAFVACRNSAEESQLLEIYLLLLVPSDGSFFYTFHNERRSLTHTASFASFWKSYEAGTLLQLIDSHDLKHLRTRLPYLESFLSVPPSGPHPSVWDLKQFLENADLTTYPPIPAIACDYGFFNCNTLEDTFTLMEIYRQVLNRANPMDLHKACITGRLFEFASEFLEMEEGWRLLLENPYPLGGTLEVKEVAEGQQRTGMGMGMGGRDGADGDVVEADKSLQQQIERQKGWCRVM